MKKESILLSILLSILFVACSKDDEEGYAGVSDYAKELGLKEAAINQDANSTEICYFVKENGDSIILVGDKDANGCASNIYLMKYNNKSEQFSTRFDEQMRPISLKYNNVDITFDWKDEKTAVVKAWDPESNTYITTVWNSEETSQAEKVKTRSYTTNNNVGKRHGEMKLTINDRQEPKPTFTRATSVEELDWKYCNFSVTQCEYPKDASVIIHLHNPKTHKYIEMLDYYKKISTGEYLFRIPPSSWPAKATNKELCSKIDWGLNTLKVGLTWLAGFSSVSDAIAMVCASTGMGVPPAAILTALSKATLIGAGTLTVFMDGMGGSEGLMKKINPDWYYREYVIADLELVPVVLYPDYVTCDKIQITPESPDVNIHCDIDGDPTLDSFTLNPDFPAAGQSYVASATYHCVPVGSTITMSIVGTDGYSNSRTSKVTNTSGTAELYVPGAETGVKDVCKVVITPTEGKQITMTASLMFGY